jgi:hypothetical protein
MANLFDPPATAELPVSLGRDIILTFRNKVPGSNPVEYVDYPLNVAVKLVVGKGLSAIEAPADIRGHEAVCRIESAAADTIKAGALWRVIVSTADDLIDDDVPMNGTVVRFDGA